MEQLDVVVQEQESEENTLLFQEAEDLKKTAMDIGFSEAMAQKLKLKKITYFKDFSKEEYKFYKEYVDQITLMRIIPMELFGGITEWSKLSSRQRIQKLWGVGIDRHFVIDVGCTTVGGKRHCDYIIKGQERTDDEWCNMIVGGKHVASWEAQLHNKKDYSLVQELNLLSRGC